MTPKGRADTPEAKRAIIERILRVWCESASPLRLGQLLENAMSRVDSGLFYVEDESLAIAVERFGEVVRR